MYNTGKEIIDVGKALLKDIFSQNWMEISIVCIVVLIFILITLFATIINTKIPLIKNPIKKKIAVIVSVAVFVGVYFLYNEIDFSKLDKQEMTITLPKNKRIDENNSNLLVDTTTFIQKIGKDKDDGEAIYSFEGYYQCLNTFVSKNIFKELVLERERQTRMQSD